MSPPGRRLAIVLVLLACAASMSGCLKIPLGSNKGPDPEPPPEGPYREAAWALRGITGDWSGEVITRSDDSDGLAIQALRVTHELARDGLHLISHREVLGERD
ncbi:MAG: hypothetical protein AAFX85_04205, partial [Pseudomonadota bacterium]